MNRRIVALALPSIVSNITVPLLGLMDVAIVGHLGRASYIGAIAVGGMLFSMIYWGFGFLRMGTSGLTSQALGRRNLEEVMTQFLRAQGVAQAIALLLLLLQWPLETLVFHFVDASPEVRHWAGVYFRICIWGAPAVLGLYALTGWFIGMQNSRFPMFVAIFQNVVNIVFSLFFVYALDWGVHGVAGGTLLAQWSGFLLSFWLCFHFYRRLWRKARGGLSLTGLLLHPTAEQSTDPQRFLQTKRAPQGAPFLRLIQPRISSCRRLAAWVTIRVRWRIR